MTEVDISNPDLLRSVDPIRKSVYDEGMSWFYRVLSEITVYGVMCVDIVC